MFQARRAGYEPPGYANLECFDETEATVGKGEWALPGTLSMPEGFGPFPAVVLVHGSGPHDRDETVGPNKPFRDLAWGLASRGVAVLRYDRRTQVHAAKLIAIQDKVTVNEETVEDAVAAASLLRTTGKIDAKRRELDVEIRDGGWRAVSWVCVAACVRREGLGCCGAYGEGEGVR